MSRSKLVIIKTPPISNLESLASILSSSVEEIISISENIDKYHKPGKIKYKKNGDKRITHDAKAKLKIIHERIKNRLLKKVSYPYFIMGGIQDLENPRSIYSHASVHLDKKILIAEDIANFFPSVNIDIVKRIWQHCFHFTPEIAEILAKLTTYENELPQGWRTSGYLANLVFWDTEHEIVEKLERQGYSYSRFMDDITVSSATKIDPDKKTEIITLVYGMLFSKGFKPRRDKHEIMTPIHRMNVTGLGVNSKKMTISRAEKSRIRACVYQLEKRAETERNTKDFTQAWRSASGLVARMKKLHAAKGTELKERLNAIKPPKHLLNTTKPKKTTK